MNPMFSTTAIRGMYSLMQDELKDLTAYLNEQNLREPININDILQKVALVGPRFESLPVPCSFDISFLGCVDSSRIWHQLRSTARR